jgi:2-hydroxy-3-keto-5-methylthiopentenyl-1-phosphate phosphatase
MDWDGTATDVDFLEAVITAFGDERIYEETESELGRLTLNEVIAIETATVSAPLAEVVAWVREHARLRPGFPEFARRYRPLIVSSGFRELIDPVLEREGLELEVVANRLDPRPDGWRAIFRNEELCPVCGEPCKRADVKELAAVAYVGDGVSDRCVALVAERVFARDGLARYLASRDVSFEPYEDFYDVARALDGDAVVPPARSRGRKT